MLSTYNKPHLPIKQQLNLLKARGLEVSNDNAALVYLTRIGYYRLSAYWYPLRLPLISQDPNTQKIKVSRQDKFCPRIKFENTLNIWDAIADTPEQAANLRTRAELMMQISELVKANGWTQAEAATHCGVTQPRMNDLLRGRVSRFSLDALVNIATATGRRVHMELQTA